MRKGRRRILVGDPPQLRNRYGWAWNPSGRRAGSGSALCCFTVPRTNGAPSRRGCGTATEAVPRRIGEPSSTRLVSTRVSFEPGARTAWHTHPLGQALYVISGVGRVQAKGGPIREIRPGDVVWIPPGEKHWHGASPTNAMTHIAMQEAANGSYVTWMEHVTDAEYSEKVG